MKKPKDLHEITNFIYEKLKEEYGDNVIMDDVSCDYIAVRTETIVDGCDDVCVSIEYFH